MSGHPRIVRRGSIVIAPDGFVQVLDFEMKNTDCAEHIQLGLAWGMAKLVAALKENMTASTPKLSGYGSSDRKEVESLRAKLRELAGGCAECNGTGVSDDTHEDCEACDDIRELLRTEGNP